MFKNLKSWVDTVKSNVYALYLISIDSRVPRFPKLMMAIIVAYLLSPVDLIPDFIPVLGYLDDFILLPLAFWLVIRLVPKEVWQECQAMAKEHPPELPHSRLVVVFIVSIWLVAAILFSLWLWPGLISN